MNIVEAMVEMNINDYRKVKLLPKGLDYLHKNNLHIPSADNQGYTKWQLWHFMQTFGPTIYLGEQPMFETTIILCVR